MIDILVPVLGRPKNAQVVADSAREATSNEYELHFLCSPGDDEQIAACRATDATVHVMDFPAQRSDYPRKMNEGFNLTERPLVFLGADDVHFHAGWDIELLKVGCLGVTATNDQANPEVMRGGFGTHNMVLRIYIADEGGSLDGPGSVFSLAYDHNWCDRELCHLAAARGRYRFAAKSIVKHWHPHWGTAEPDQTYQKGQLNFFLDRRTYASRGRRAGLWR